MRDTCAGRRQRFEQGRSEEEKRLILSIGHDRLLLGRLLRLQSFRLSLNEQGRAMCFSC